MARDIKTPQVASTISPPRHVMASVERGKLGQSERIALNGLASYGSDFIGTQPILTGDWQSAQARNVRNSFSGELAAPSPTSPYNDDSLATMAGAHCSDGTIRPIIVVDGVTLLVRTTRDGDAVLPSIVETVADRKAREKATVAAARPQHKGTATPSEGPRIKVEDDRVVTSEVDLVEQLLRSMGHKGKITGKMRDLAMDVLAKQQQDAAYIGH